MGWFVVEENRSNFAINSCKARRGGRTSGRELPERLS